MRKIFKVNDQRGVAAVEFAIVLPILLIIFAGITEFGIAYYNKQVITNASREGARAGITRSNREDPDFSIEEAVQNYALDRLITFGGSSVPVLDPLPEDDGEYLKVSVKFTYTYLIFEMITRLFEMFSNANFEPNLDIRSATTMRIE